MSTVEREGGCYCGAVRYRITVAPIRSLICHCADCRRICGAQSVAWVQVSLEGFRIEQGEPVRYQSSPAVIRTFCAVCGTSLTYETTDCARYIDITTASLDDPEEFPPQGQDFEEQKLSWV